MKDVIQVSHKQLTMIVDRCFTTKLPMWVHGTFGVGKSSIIEAFGRAYAEKHGLKFVRSAKDCSDDTFAVIVIPLHQFDVGEIKGLMVPNYERKTAEYFTTDLLPMKGLGIIFFDEGNGAFPAVQKNMYQLLEERKLGDYYVPEGFLVIGAGNTMTDRAGVNEMDMPLKNRVAHVELMIPLVSNYGHPERTGWIEDYASTHNINKYIQYFLMFRDDLLHNYNPDSIEEDLTVIATPRTWEKASKQIDGIEFIESNYPMLEMFIGSFVGASIGKNVIDFVRMSKTYDIAKIYKTRHVDVPTETSEKYALIAAISSYYEKLKDKESAEALLEIIFQFDDEHAVLLLRNAIEVTPNMLIDLLEIKTAAKLVGKASEKYIKLLGAA
jgi:hypothetical protein